MKRQKLARLRELKEFTKEQLELEVRKAREAMEFEKAKLGSLKKDRAGTIAEFSCKHNGQISNSYDLENFYSYTGHLNRQIEQQELVVVSKTAELEEKQEAMLEAYKDERILGKLHDKILGRELRETLLSEQKAADFNFSSRSARG